MKIGCHKRRLLPFLFPLVKTFPMSRFSSVLFAVGFGLFASLTTLVSCGDTDNFVPASSKVDEAKEGTYKIEVSVVGDIVTYNPVITVLGLHQSSACTPLVGFIADSAYNAAIDNKTRLYSEYSLTLYYGNYPSLFNTPFSVVTIPQAHGLSITATSVGRFHGGLDSKVTYNFKGYFNDRLLKDTIIKHEAKDLPVTFMIGNMSGDVYKRYKEAQSK